MLERVVCGIELRIYVTATVLVPDDLPKLAPGELDPPGITQHNLMPPVIESPTRPPGSRNLPPV